MRDEDEIKIIFLINETFNIHLGEHAMADIDSTVSLQRKAVRWLKRLGNVSTS